MIVSNPRIITRVSIMDTLRLLQPGDSGCYLTKDLGPYISVYTAINRLNRLAGYEEYDLDTDRECTEYIITRNHPLKWEEQ